MSLISIFGNLRNAYRGIKIQPDSSMCHINQLMQERARDDRMCDQQIYAADGLIFFLEGNTPKVAITREQTNPVLQNLEEACQKLSSTGIYRLRPKEVTKSLRDHETVILELSQLPICSILERYDTKDPLFGYVKVSTNDYHNYTNPELHKLLHRVQGQGRGRVRAMKKLSEAGIKETKIYLLKPEYVVEKAKNGPFAMIWWLNNFRFNSNIVIDNHPFDQRHAYGIGKEEQVALKDTFRATRPYLVK